MARSPQDLDAVDSLRARKDLMLLLREEAERAVGKRVAGLRERARWFL